MKSITISRPYSAVLAQILDTLPDFPVDRVMIVSSADESSTIFDFGQFFDCGDYDGALLRETRRAIKALG